MKHLFYKYSSIHPFDLLHTFKVFFTMEFSNKFYSVLILFVFTFLLNLPFGYARGKSKRYSLRWFLYIHVPIPIIFIARTISYIEFKYIPLLALAAIIGQIVGDKLEF